MSRRTNQKKNNNKKNKTKQNKQTNKLKNQPSQAREKAITIVMLFTSRQVNREGHI